MNTKIETLTQREAITKSKTHNAMNKVNKLFTIFTMIAMTLVFTSCVQDDDFSIPSSLGDEENIGLEALLASSNLISIADAKAMYQQGSAVSAVTSDIYIKGYVTSSDRTGNFFKEIFLQDSPENPTAGIKITVNQVETYNQFNVGREVYVNLKGLFIGEERVGNKVITIGGSTKTDQFGTAVLRMTQKQMKNHMFRSQETAAMIPLTLGITDISNANIGMLVKLEEVEFADNLNGLQYFDPTEEFDTRRKLQACTGFSYSTLPLETSSYATFKEVYLPTGNGNLTGVISKTHDGSSLIIALNDPEDVNMTGDRCSLFDLSEFDIIFEQDFETVTNNTNINFPGWTNFSEAGSFKWRGKSFEGNGYTEFSSFNSGNASNIGWLITPGIDMDAQDNEFLNFKTAQHHLDSPLNTIEVFISTDYNGTNVLAATWEPIDAPVATQSNAWYEMVDSGLIDLSGYTGTLYVAFKVVGSGTVPLQAGSYQVDDIKILAN